MKIALIADLHLSDVENTPQEESFDWALRELDQIKPDVCVWLGDITACGSFDAAMRFRSKIDRLSAPSVTVAGNSDIRTAETAPVMERFLSNYSNGFLSNGIRIVGMNTSHDSISPSERARLSSLDIQENILLCSHQSPKHIDEESLAFLRSWISKLEAKGHKVLAWVHGHIHRYKESFFDALPTISVRALDLDKNIGGNAHICVMQFLEDGKPSVAEINYPHATLDTWSEDELVAFSEALGISCYNKSKLERDMPFAIENRVRHLEWRSIKEGEIALIEQWRRVGGQTFSLHFPSLGFDGSAITGLEKFHAYSADTVRASADMITIHPPYIRNEIMLNGTLFDSLADATAEALLPVANAGIDILVENNHTKLGTPSDPLKREYGCSPAELIGWRDALRERLGKDRCHLRLDIGHARNNMPLSQDYPIGKWYALVGGETRSYHLHQTIFDKEAHCMRNHYPIMGLHDGFVSFDGFLWAWKHGILNHAPIILEIREGEGACATWSRLQGMVQKR